jgi:hypothetical protein
MVINVFEKSLDTASTVVAINGGFIFVGRLMFSSLSDVIGRKPSYLVMLGPLSSRSHHFRFRFTTTGLIGDVIGATERSRRKCHLREK